ncbi:hypothetical protein [Filimonas effusa]|uniref:PEGA domain-containing protein n=1 Tax=Filimonas effusa TaxID=2508721 RepID=A0A4Q1D5W8_9BACT|nr:hypothetical protein [Filimonas effusa]RXK83905.1 hypothetical protein ESB13_17700 [Filimonas effusa]
MTSKPILAFIAIISFFSSCATIIKGSRQSIPVSYKQDNVNVYINGTKQTGALPELYLKRSGEPLKDSSGKKGYVLLFHKPGYQDSIINLGYKHNGWIWPNLLFGGIIGIAIDIATKANRTLTPKELVIDLKKD